MIDDTVIALGRDADWWFGFGFGILLGASLALFYTLWLLDVHHDK